LILKLQTSFHELPAEAHISLRDSLLQHIAAISGATDHIIVTQLCLAVTHLILQASSWADPISQLLGSFGSDASHWWPVLEILTLLPEEVHSRKLQLGENRRHQVTHQLETVAPTVLSFLKECLSVCLGTPADSNALPVETCLINVVKCFGSWILINPECFFTNQAVGSGDVLTFVMGSLREGKVKS
jgi:transportin-3